MFGLLVLKILYKWGILFYQGKKSSFKYNIQMYRSAVFLQKCMKSEYDAELVEVSNAAPVDPVDDACDDDEIALILCIRAGPL